MKKICTIENCNRDNHSYGLCSMHAKRLKKHGTVEKIVAKPKKRICSFGECKNRHDSHGYCANHARQWRKYGHPLSSEEVHTRLSKKTTQSLLAYYANNPNRPKRAWSDEAKTRARGITTNTGRTHFTKGCVPLNKGMKMMYAAWNKGIKLEFPAWNKGKSLPQVQGEKNHQWKGDKVSYRSLHKWVERYLGKPSKCEQCGTDNLSGRKIHWSNVSGAYRRELNDWQRLCAKCHKAYDKQLRMARIRG